MMSVKHSSDEHGPITIRKQQWHAYLGSNQLFSCWTEGLFNKREIVPGTRKVDNYLGLVTSWIMEEKLQPHFTKPE